MRGRLEAGLRATWNVLEEGPAEDRRVSGSRLLESLRAWQREAESWARGGGPPANGGEGGAKEAGEVRDILSEHALSEPQAPARELLLTELVTRVEVMVTKGGSISSYRVVESSGNLAHDGMVLSLLRQLASEAPGGEDRGPSEGGRALWAVRTRFEVMPPLPVVGCAFDATFHPAGCFYPLKRTVKSSARLERILRGGGSQVKIAGSNQGLAPSGAYAP